MPFGRHRGQPLDEIDDGYLRWLVTIELRDWLRAAVEEELEARAGGSSRRRQRQSPPPPTATVPVALRSTADELVTAGLRALTRKYHPDVTGGAHDRMVAANLAAEALRRVVRA